MKTLGGWQRLGIVLAAIWCIVVVSYAFSEYDDISSEYKSALSMPAPPKGFVLEPKTNPYFFIWQPANIVAREPSSFVPEYKFNFIRFLAVLLGPIFSVLLLAISASWVRQGFKN